MNLSNITHSGDGCGDAEDGEEEKFDPILLAQLKEKLSGLDISKLAPARPHDFEKDIMFSVIN